MSNLADLTKHELITYLQSILDVLNGIDGLVGDIPVSEQLGAALSHMAKKEHTHGEYALRKDLDTLKIEIEYLASLVGDVAVSEQISAAINKTK